MITKTETRKQATINRIAKKPIVTLGQHLRNRRIT